MHLEDYFDILSSDDRRIKGHRLGIAAVDEPPEVVRRVRALKQARRAAQQAQVMGQR